MESNPKQAREALAVLMKQVKLKCVITLPILVTFDKVAETEEDDSTTSRVFSICQSLFSCSNVDTYSVPSLNMLHYKGGTSLALLRFSFAFVLCFLVMIVYMFTDNFFQLGLTSDDAIEIFTIPFIYTITILILSPQARKKFVSWFILKKEETYKSICYPVLVAIIQSFLVYIYMYMPYWLGSDAISIGSNQVTTVEGVTEIGLTIGTSIIGPFVEEFIFRFILIAGFMEIMNSLISKYKRLIKIKPIAIIFLILFTNSFFSLMHGPDLLSFPLYFVGGLISSLFFIRYGFLAAWISHGMFNFLSPIAHSIIDNLFM